MCREKLSVLWLALLLAMCQVYANKDTPYAPITQTQQQETR